MDYAPDVLQRIYIIRILEYMREIVVDFRFVLNICIYLLWAFFLLSVLKRKWNYWLTFAALMGTIAMPTDTGIANTDLIGALGNLLDNAEEACETVEGAPFIDIEILIQASMLLLCVENALPPATKSKRKIPYMDRGIGFHVLNDIAGRYNGAFTPGESGDRFTAKLTLACKEVKYA